ncbi:orotidine-5'-phosphate decarboxylase [Fictibacillus iocasae]|uniref:Orotidine 5'-phosphate decarboxylase n=1 Tax=Fictibacillus iocasae TaxID=2715437 RepID=A0ABW2NSE5_9BACL
MQNTVIIALDFPDRSNTESFLRNFHGESLFVKVGMELFYREGISIVNTLKEKGHRVFLDLKLHDIPNTVHKAMKNLAAAGVDMVNVHGAGGISMMAAAKEGLYAGSSSGQNPLLIAVTQLTSTSEEMLNEELLIKGCSLDQAVLHYALNAKKAGLDGVVSSVNESTVIKEVCGSQFITVTPGIRLAGGKVHDQIRVATPRDAAIAKADYIVAGRSITEAEDPRAAYTQIYQEWSGQQHEITYR